MPFPSPGDLPDPGIEPASSGLQADSLPSEPPGKPGPVEIQRALPSLQGRVAAAYVSAHPQQF